MSVLIESLFHWSPTERRQSIMRHGLRIQSEPTCSTAPSSYICFGPDPYRAWQYSADIFGEAGSSWDLWQFIPNSHDDIRLRRDGMRGSRFIEARVWENVPYRRLFLLGTKAKEQRRRPGW